MFSASIWLREYQHHRTPTCKNDEAITEQPTCSSANGTPRMLLERFRSRRAR